MLLQIEGGQQPWGGTARASN